MLDYIYEWIQNIAFYLVLVTAVVHMMPDSDYKKYIRFFTGLVLILLILTPILKIFRMDDWITDIYKSEDYKEQIKKMETSAEYLKDKGEVIPAEEDEKQKQFIEVEEIRIDE